MNWIFHCSRVLWICSNPSSILSFTFQCRPYLSKIRHPQINTFLSGNKIPSAKRKATAKGTLGYWWSAIFNKLLNDKRAIFVWQNHGLSWKRHVYSYSTTCFHHSILSLPTACCLSNSEVVFAAFCINSFTFDYTHKKNVDINKFQSNAYKLTPWHNKYKKH